MTLPKNAAIWARCIDTASPCAVRIPFAENVIRNDGTAIKNRSR